MASGAGSGVAEPGAGKADRLRIEYRRRRLVWVGQIAVALLGSVGWWYGVHWLIVVQDGALFGATGAALAGAWYPLASRFVEVTW